MRRSRAILKDRPPLSILLICAVCGWKQEHDNPGVAVCVCGSRCFQWDDRLKDNEKKAEAIQRQGRAW